MEIIKQENTSITTEIAENLLVKGDLSKLSTVERLQYYKATCDSLGLNSLTKPFEYITLNGKLTLYAKKDATDQLRRMHGVNITSLTSTCLDGIYIVTAHAKTLDGREDVATGAVSINGLKGDALANAFMKAESKAKRRVTLSICGLGLLDETEIETIPQREKIIPLSEEEVESAVLDYATMIEDSQTTEELKIAFEEAKRYFKNHDIFPPVLVSAKDRKKKEFEDNYE